MMIGYSLFVAALVWVGSLDAARATVESLSDADLLMGNGRVDQDTCVGGEYSACNDSSLERKHLVVEWLTKEMGGYVSDKLSIQADGQVYALQDIRQEELLMTIPEGASINTFSETVWDEEEQVEVFSCDSAAVLVMEYLDESSSYRPYLEFLFEHVAPNQKHPSSWTNDGKDLMKRIIGNGLAPQDFGATGKITVDCDIGDLPDLFPDDTILNDHAKSLLGVAWRLVVSREYASSAMIPGFDMIPHRNGAFHNVDIVDTPFSSTWNDTAAYDPRNSTYQRERVFRVQALRNISAGEPIHRSLNECRFCDGFILTHAAPEIMSVQGFLEPYPRRWRFTTGYDQDVDTGFVFEISKHETVLGDASRASFDVTWFTGEPSFPQLNWIQAHLKRLEGMADTVASSLSHLEDTYEQVRIREYFEGLLTAFKQVHIHAQFERNEREGEGMICQNEHAIETCIQTDPEKDSFDNLKHRSDSLSYEFDVADNCLHSNQDTLEALDKTTSLYQEIEFEHYKFDETEQREVCLVLAGFPQSCTSLRAHYHEALVHYPASFLDNVKRVLFMGGGDLMILDEILKYDVEFVYGMELDQEVARQSFRNYGIEPRFDDPRVRWFFGDAAKSLLMLPEEYYGTFDLVLVDLMTYVADTNMVKENMTLLDMGMHLLKPNGILVQNHDFQPREKPTFAKYSVNLLFDSIPIFCHEYLTMASNGVDFASKAPRDHNISTLFYDARNNPYAAWTNYHHNTDHTSGQLDEPVNVRPSTKSYGLLTTIEVEKARLSLGDKRILRTRISKALVESGLSEIGYTSFSRENNKGRFYDQSLAFSLREGFVVARPLAKLKYCAFDVLLWSDYGTQETVLRKLVEAVESQVDGSTTSFHLSTGGMFRGSPKVETPKAIKIPTKGSRSLKHTRNFDIQDYAQIISEVTSAFPRANPAVVVVVCGTRRSTCRSLAALEQAKEMTGNVLVPLWTCPTVHNRTLSIDSMKDCELTSRLHLLKSSARQGKFGAIVIDPDVPREMGQILHKTIQGGIISKNLLMNTFVMIAPEFEKTTDPWRSVLMERFREIVAFNPVYHVTAEFGSAAKSLQMNVMSVGDPTFYSHLVKVGSRIKEKMGLHFEIESGKSGVVSYSADFNSKFVANDDYDMEGARAQWYSQKTICQQEVFQLEIQLPLEEIELDEIVLINVYDQHFEGIWQPGIIMNQTGLLYRVLTEDRKYHEVERKLLRKTDEYERDLFKGDRILMRQQEAITGFEMWRQGYIAIDHGDETYTVRIATLGEDTVLQVDRDDLIPQSEELAPLDESRKVTIDKLKDALNNTFKQLHLNAHIVAYDDDNDIGQGCVLFAAWSLGDIVVTWDGQHHVDLNVLSNLKSANIGKVFQQHFMKDMALGLVGRDRFPRGVGRVVTFENSNSKAFWFGDLN
eukprot:CAMPEP_0172453388 /NCGR_PEP_ID=MMETSP1065-20121228/10732_1 /TAXON_ID=265537 /ORGANISM="Amphiprora paludosa, Strain CCMP125" /LENGTH=1413 /DNA_ID=CAMNT_0013205567 /DNA_START=84 /DNA_END=4325 /DNA_ORIENTATION=-